MENVGKWNEYDWNHWKKIFINFIGAYFNMDTDNIYMALNEYIEESDLIDKVKTLNSIKKFLSYDKMSSEEKEELLQEETMIFYEGYGLSPLEWLTYIEIRLEEEINK